MVDVDMGACGERRRAVRENVVAPPQNDAFLRQRFANGRGGAGGAGGQAVLVERNGDAVRCRRDGGGRQSRSPSVIVQAIGEGQTGGIRRRLRAYGAKNRKQRSPRRHQRDEGEMEDVAGRNGRAMEFGALQSSEGHLSLQDKGRRPGWLVGQNLPLFDWALVSWTEGPCTRCRSGP